MPRKRKPYTARTLRGAQTRARQLQRIVDNYERWFGRMTADRQLLAKLAAEGPCFDNPLLAIQATKLRDQILRDECGLAPDGKLLPRAEQA